MNGPSSPCLAIIIYYGDEIHGDNTHLGTQRCVRTLMQWDS